MRKVSKILFLEWFRPLDVKYSKIATERLFLAVNEDTGQRIIFLFEVKRDTKTKKVLQYKRYRVEDTPVLEKYVNYSQKK